MISSSAAPLPYSPVASPLARTFRSPRRAALIFAWSFYITAALGPFVHIAFYLLYKSYDFAKFLPEWFSDAFLLALWGLPCHITAAILAALEPKLSHPAPAPNLPAARLFRQSHHIALLFAFALYLSATITPISKTQNLLHHEPRDVPANLFNYWIPDALKFALLGLLPHMTSPFLAFFNQKFAPRAT